MIESAFDIHQPLLDEDGAPDRDRVKNFVDRLLEQFLDSPEFEEFRERYPGSELESTRELLFCVVECERSELGNVDPGLLEHLLLEHSPHEVCLFDLNGEQSIAEMRAFFAFLDHRFDLDNVASCVEYLQQQDLAEDFEEAMNDPGNFSVTKCTVFLGEQAGFDMTEEDELQRFEAILNEAIAGSQPFPHNLETRFSPSPLIERLLSRYDRDLTTHNLLERLMNAGGDLYNELHQELLNADESFLIDLLNDRDLAREHAPGEGWIPVHAARILGERREEAATSSLIAVVTDYGPDDLIYSVALSALKQIGRPAIESIVTTIRHDVDRDARRDLSEVLSSLEDRRLHHR